MEPGSFASLPSNLTSSTEGSSVSVTPIDSKVRGHREAVLTALLAAQNRHDVEASLACFAHPRYELVGNQRVYEGADEVRRYYATTFGAFPDLTFELIESHHADRSMIVEMWMGGSHLGSRTTRGGDISR